MGFLDRMLTDLIAGSAPRQMRRPVRKMVRSVGAGKLLLLGGAAVAGAIAAQRATSARSQGTATPGPAPTTPPLPPLPPTPGASQRPDLPPLPPIPATPPTGSDDDLPPGLTYPVVRAMIGAALADGEVSGEERRAIQDRLGDSGLAETQVRQIHRDLVVPPSPAEIADLATSFEERAAVYRAALLVSLADHDLSAAERAWLDRLASSLGFAAVTREDLERDLLETVSAAADPA